MDKYEYKVRADEIKDLIDQGEYAQAAEIADTIDWRRVKSVMMLCTISDLYKINRRYEDARDLLLLAYERRPGGRTICYSLCELSIKIEEYVQAIEYYKEFVQVAPKDPGRYILQYKLYEAQDVSLEERIAVLEELKDKAYREKWWYELAYLYHRIGLATKCVEECDGIIAFFGDGKYVIKAMELKMLHQPLSQEQQEKYDHRFDELETAAVEETGYEDEKNRTEEDVIYSEENIGDSESEYYAEDSLGDTKVYKPVSDEELNRYNDSPEVEYSSDDVEPESSEVQINAEPEEYDIQVKPMDMGKYNTMNLQAEIAAGVLEVLENNTNDKNSDPVMKSIMAPMMESDTESLDMIEIDEVDAEDLEEESAPEEMESSEVFFGETGEIEQVDSPEKTEENSEEIIPEENTSEEAFDINVEKDIDADSGEEVKDTTAETVMAQLRDENLKEAARQAMSAQPPKEIADVLSQESDGQISLVVPENRNVEKQITGQMNIEDILVEWERMKRENAEKNEEEVRRHVLQQTGDMFTEFEAAVRDGLLEQMEKDAGIRGADETVSESVEPAADEAEETAEIEEIEEIDEIEEISEVEETEEIEEVEEIEEISEETVEIDDIESTEEEIFEEINENEEIDQIEETEEISQDDGEYASEEVTEEEIEEPAEETPEVDENKEIQPEPAALDKDEPIERETAKARALTHEEKELYAPFIQSKSARTQLVNVIDNVSMAAYTGNIILTGEEGTDTLTLAKNIVREIKSSDSNFSGRIAKISGESLNNKNVADTMAQLSNGALIIQKASNMNEETSELLYQSLQQESYGIIVILEDVPRAMDRFLAKNKKFLNSFTNRMDVEALNNDTLVEFGRQYARELEYSIDDFGILALHTRIEERQTLNHAVTVMDVKEIVDRAIKHANKKSVGHFFDILFARRYDDEDMIVLGEKDFNF